MALLHPDDRYVWEDLGKPIDGTIDAGIAAFTQKFGVAPNIVEVRAGVVTDRLVVFTTIVPNTFQVWLGLVEESYDNRANSEPEIRVTVPMEAWTEEEDFWNA